jgi:hypothetical protein
MLPLAATEKTSWSISESLMQALWVAASYVAKIFFFTLNEVFSKWGSSIASGNEKAKALRVENGSLAFYKLLTTSYSLSIHKK